MPTEGALPVAVAQKWFDQLPPRSALFAVNDEVARRWLAVPVQKTETLPIMGVDDDEEVCLGMRPRWPSVRWSIATAMQKACEQLSKELQAATFTPIKKSVANRKSFALRHIGVPPIAVMTRPLTERWMTDDPVLAMGLHWLQEHACEPVTVVDLADVVGCHRRRLERLFEAEFGNGPRWFIEYFRIEIAKDRLRESEDGIIDIASQCGFRNDQLVL